MLRLVRSRPLSKELLSFPTFQALAHFQKRPRVSIVVDWHLLGTRGGTDTHGHLQLVKMLIQFLRTDSWFVPNSIAKISAWLRC